MEINYRFYEPNQGLEEIQARIYNQATGDNVKSEEIRVRYETEKTNPKFIRYAFSQDGEPLAYIQARLAKDMTIHIGYPWAVPECPPEVQDKLFDELLAYIKLRKPNEISYWLNLSWKEQISFFKKKGFVRKIRGLLYSFDVKKLNQMETPDSSFSSRIATHDDLDLLLEIGREDKELSQVYSQEWLTKYFRDKVLQDGHCVLVFKDETLVCTSAPLRDLDTSTEEDRHIFLRFTATRPGYHSAWKTLLIEIGKECMRTGWTDLPIWVYLNEKSEVKGPLKELNPLVKPSWDLYVLKESQ